MLELDITLVFGKVCAKFISVPFPFFRFRQGGTGMAVVSDPVNRIKSYVYCENIYHAFYQTKYSKIFVMFYLLRTENRSF